MKLSFTEYDRAVQSGAFSFPSAFSPYCEVDPARYNRLAAQHRKRRHDIDEAFTKVRDRVGADIFQKIYSLQSSALDYSTRAFPAYRFLLPEVIADDWVATVDWRKFQRDHVVHQPQVRYAAHQILHGIEIAGDSLLDLCVNRVLQLVADGYLRSALLKMGISNDDPFLSPGPLHKALWRALFQETLCLASLFHDIGYPWQYVNRIESKLAYDGRHPITPSPASALSAYNDRLVLLPFENYSTSTGARPAAWAAEKQELIKRCLEDTHGLPGALFFLHLNDSLRPYPSESIHPVRRLCVEWAAMAILMHDMKDVYWGKDDPRPAVPQLRLRFDLDPLSCMLTLADVLQDFERHAARFDPFEAGESSLRPPTVPDSTLHYDIACNEVEVVFDETTRTLAIQYKMQNLDQVRLKRTHLAKEESQLFNPTSGFLDLSACGIRRVTMTASTGS